MPVQIVLASASEIRSALLQRAGVSIAILPARVDEQTIRMTLLQSGVPPRDVADALAEAKARKISAKQPGALVLGCDQVLEFQGKLLSKPTGREDAVDQIAAMSGKRHHLHTAAVICEGGQPVWRRTGTVELHMRPISSEYLREYVDRNWESIRHSVGGYKLEEEGVRLFSAIEGDYFHVLGMPLLEILDYLTTRGVLKS